MQITQQRTWDVPDEVMNQIAADLITTAVEGGINYWASVSDYHWSDEQPETTTVTVVDNEDEDAEPVVVTVPKMLTAIETLLNGTVEFHTMGYDKTYKSRLMSLLDEAERGVKLLDADYDYDASDADCMLQLCCFDGEIVYG